MEEAAHNTWNVYVPVTGISRIVGSHGGGYEEFYILECNAP
jgi:hypothetical protein